MSVDLATRVHPELAAVHAAATDLVCWRHTRDEPPFYDFQQDHRDDMEHCSVDDQRCVLITSLRHDGRHQLLMDIDNPVSVAPYDDGGAIVMWKHKRKFPRTVEALADHKLALPINNGLLLPDGAAVNSSGTYHHGHVFFGPPMDWDDLDDVLITAASEDMVDPYWVDHSRRRGYAALRHPGTRKTWGNPHKSITHTYF